MCEGNAIPFTQRPAALDLAAFFRKYEANTAVVNNKAVLFHRMIDDAFPFLSLWCHLSDMLQGSCVMPKTCPFRLRKFSGLSKCVNQGVAFLKKHNSLEANQIYYFKLASPLRKHQLCFQGTPCRCGRAPRE